MGERSASLLERQEGGVGDGVQTRGLVLENVVWEWGAGSLVAQRAGPSVLMMGTG